MTRLKFAVALALAVIAAPLSAAEPASGDTAGYRSLKIKDAHPARPLTGIVWYPAPEGSRTKRIQANGVWEGVPGSKNADVVGGTYPLVVLSHGMYGNIRNQNWLGEALAREGFIVAAVNHPGTSTRHRSLEQARQLWERPRDLSRVITHLTETHPLAEHIDPQRIFMAGHSLGGWTAALLAGARFDPAAYDAFCQGGTRNGACAVLDSWNIAKTPEDRAVIAGDFSDARIKGFAVLDLGGTQTLDPKSLNGITAPMLVIGAPMPNQNIDLDEESRAFAAGMTSAAVTYLEPEGTSHFDFMGLCTERGLAILQDEEPQDAIVCENGTDERRARHAAFVTAIKAHFAQH